MTTRTALPDPAGHPGLSLMEATAALLRGDRAAAPAGDAMGGAFLEAEAPRAMADDAVALALARIDALEAIDARARTAAGRAGRALGELLLLPDPLREAAFVAMDAGRRWKVLGLGLRSLALDLGGGGRTELLRIEPGAGVARHDHDGEEYTLVITGAFHDGHARYGPGEVNIGRPGFMHEPVAEKGELCFALAVSFGPPRFKGPFRLIQKLVGR
ncbi:MAG: cupin domain-containing protein [Pseudomonadota bacterium]